jgi:hypothetical protein
MHLHETINGFKHYFRFYNYKIKCSVQDWAICSQQEETSLLCKRLQLLFCVAVRWLLQLQTPFVQAAVRQKVKRYYCNIKQMTNSTLPSSAT